MSSTKMKHFSVDGIAVDGEAVIRVRNQVEEKMVEDMRREGYVPVMDIPSKLYWNYDADKNEFIYKVVIHGTYVGKKKSKDILGMLGSRPIKIEK